MALPDALRLTAGGLHDAYLAAGCRQAADEIEAGRPLAESMAARLQFPASLIPLVAAMGAADAGVGRRLPGGGRNVPRPRLNSQGECCWMPLLLPVAAAGDCHLGRFLYHCHVLALDCPDSETFRLTAHGNRHGGHLAGHGGVALGPMLLLGDRRGW